MVNCWHKKTKADIFHVYMFHSLLVLDTIFLPRCKNWYHSFPMPCKPFKVEAFYLLYFPFLSCFCTYQLLSLGNHVVSCFPSQKQWPNVITPTSIDHLAFIHLPAINWSLATSELQTIDNSLWPLQGDSTILLHSLLTANWYCAFPNLSIDLFPSQGIQ